LFLLARELLKPVRKFIFFFEDFVCHPFHGFFLFGQLKFTLLRLLLEHLKLVHKESSSARDCVIVVKIVTLPILVQGV
jgi:hypothetical protein